MVFCFRAAALNLPCGHGEAKIQRMVLGRLLAPGLTCGSVPIWRWLGRHPIEAPGLDPPRGIPDW